MLGERMGQLGLAGQYLCPQLPVEPRCAAQLILDTVNQSNMRDGCIVGSSLGGFYATWLAEQTGMRAVLLNPAVRPDRDLERHLGVQPVYHSNETIEVKPDYLEQLMALRTPQITDASRYFLIAAKGDEVLDWREMVGHYPGARLHLLEAGDHGLSNFAELQDEVLEFAGISVSGQRGHMPS